MKEGYKKTAIGEVPVNWDVSKLSELIDSLDAGVSVNSEDKPAGENEFGILKTSAVSSGKFFPDQQKGFWKQR